jgi:HD-GYP domain-containing protein (c-di-GMP phosphodiesterase class II)
MPEKKINDSSDEAELVLDQMLDQDVVVRRAAAAAAPAKAAALGNGTAAAAHALTLREIRREPRVRVYIAKANEQMASIGYTEHGHRHAGIVATIARSILSALGQGERLAELAAIAGYLHDIGCVVNRAGHVEAGAIIAFHILSTSRWTRWRSPT